MSKKLTLDAAGTAATVADATIGDIFSTILSQNEALTGGYALIQRAVLVVGGMAVQNYRVGQGINPFK